MVLATTTETRNEFEKWAREQGFHLSENIHKDYANSKVNWMWKAYVRIIYPASYPKTVGKSLPTLLTKTLLTRL